MFNDINSYMEKSRQERRNHLKLQDKCIEIGGGSKEFKGLLAHYLCTTIPQGRSIQLCHACHNGKCSNVLHLYWGSPRDNHLDQVENNSYQSLTTRTKEKYGQEKYDAFIKAHLNKARLQRGNPKNKLSPDRLDEIKDIILSFPIKHGYIGKIAKTLNVSHTQVRRYIKMLNLESNV